jgi:hypothetical protein
LLFVVLYTGRGQNAEEMGEVGEKPYNPAFLATVATLLRFVLELLHVVNVLGENSIPRSSHNTKSAAQPV